MTKNNIGKSEITFLIISLTCLLLVAAIRLYFNFQESVVQKRSSELAQILGVDIQKYEPDMFPVNYFQQALSPGMSIKEVHQIVKGYQKSLICPRANAEVYYFYSYDDEGVKIKLTYDLADNSYVDMIIDDNNSSLINVNGCAPGLLGE